MKDDPMEMVHIEHMDLVEYQDSYFALGVKLKEGGDRWEGFTLEELEVLRDQLSFPSSGGDSWLCPIPPYYTGAGLRKLHAFVSGAVEWCKKNKEKLS